MKKPIKSIVTSSLLAVAFGALSVGSTFALFTSQSKTEINVESGIVNVESRVSLVSYSSSVDGTNEVFPENTISYNNPLIGNEFSLNGSTVNINKMVPGDKLTVRLTSINKSNVMTKTRFVVNHAEKAGKDDLYPALKVSFAPEGLITEPELFKWKTNSPVENTDDGEVLHSVLVSIELPDRDNGQILFGTQNNDNEYQDCACSIIFDFQAVQGNAQTNPIDEINAYLGAQLMLEGHNDTMHDAVIDMTELGYLDLDILDGYVYDLANDKFVSETSVSDNYNNYFKVYSDSEVPNPQTFSIYADSDWAESDVTVTGVGFDIGDANPLTSLTYLKASDPRSNILRTNSLDTDVTINADTDIVKHYGDARHVDIIAVLGSSYHEYGRVAFFEIANGRVALEKGAEVSRMHFAYDTENSKFNDIVIAYDEAVELPKFSRDAVETIAEGGTLVVELQNSTNVEEAESDYVWLYQQGLVQQMRVSDNKTDAGAVSATDESVKQETHQVAQDIANSIKSSATTDYTEEQIVAGEVDIADIDDNGIEEADKTEIINEIIEEVVTEDAKEASDNYVARIGAKYFTSFDAAFDAAVSGNTLRVIRSCSAPRYNTSWYDASGMNLNIFVEPDVTLSCGTVTNGKFVIGQNNQAGTLTFEGEGRITFNKDNNWGLVYNMGSGNNIKVICRDLLIEANSSNGFIVEGNLTIESGYYKNISFMSGQNVVGGLFTYDVNDLLPEGKMTIDSGNAEFPYAVGDLDAAHANFSILHAGQLKYYRTLDGVYKNAVSGDTVQFISSNPIVNVDSGENKFNTTNGVTYDLNNHTIKATASAYAFYVGAIGSKTITVKNGRIDATLQLCEQNTSAYTYTVIAENLYINSAIKTSALSHITNGVYVKCEENFFLITESAPLEYAAKIEKSSGDRTDFYYTGEYGLKSCLLETVNEDHLFVYEYDAEAKVTLASLQDSILITRDPSVQFPEVVSSAGDIDEQVIDEYTTRFTAIVAPVCSIDSTVYYSLKDAFDALTNLASGKEIVLKKDVILDRRIYIRAKAQYGDGTLSGNRNYSLDFNGHTITNADNFDGNYLFGFANGNSSYLGGTFTFRDRTTDKNGGMVVTDSSLYCVHHSSTYYGITFESGIYKATGNIVYENNSNVYSTGGKMIFNGGKFIGSSAANGGIHLPTAGGTYVSAKIVMNGGTFAESFFTGYNITANIGGSEEIDNVIYYAYVK